MAYQSNFQRKEIKYLLSPAQFSAVRAETEARCEWDRYPTATVTSLYYDTPDSLLIRRSIEKPVYKEKLRVRVYGAATEDATAYVEIKKKYEGIVYKRRVGLNVREAAAWLRGETRRAYTQIEREIECFLDFYKTLAPAMLIACERDSFLSPADGDLRITFDRTIRFRQSDLSLLSGTRGELLLEQGTVLMEAPGTLPDWFIRMLSGNGVVPSGFSKYGAAYQKRLSEELKGGKKYA